MKPSVVLIICYLASSIQANIIFPASWSYDTRSPLGPQAWSQMFPDCAAAGQSPINIDTSMTRTKPIPEDIVWMYQTSPFTFNRTFNIAQFQRASGTIVNRVMMTEGGIKTSFVLDGVRVHSFAEHQIDGKVFPVEFEFLHTSERTQAPLIISVLAVVGRENVAFTDISRMPTLANFGNLLPADKSYFEYTGTLSTPPCTGSIRRIVLQNSIELSEAQIFYGVRAWYDINANSARPINNTNSTPMVWWNWDSTIATSTNASRPHVMSTFRDGREGWYAEPIQTGNSRWSGSNGRLTVINDFYLNVTDFAPTPIPNPAHFIAAPATFRGNLSHLYGGIISFELRSCTNDTQVNFTEGDIVIRGYRTELVASLPYKPNQYFLTRYSLSLNEAPFAEVSTFTADISCTAFAPKTKIASKSCTAHGGSYHWLNIMDATRGMAHLGCDMNCSVCATYNFSINNGECMRIPGSTDETRNFVKFGWNPLSIPHPWWRVRPAENSTVWGTPATEAEVKNVLSFVKCIKIRTRFTNMTVHNTYFDNVLLADGTGPLHYSSCPGASFSTGGFTACSGHGVCLSRFCKCHYGWMGHDCSQVAPCVKSRKFPLPRTVPDWRPFDPTAATTFVAENVPDLWGNL